MNIAAADRHRIARLPAFTGALLQVTPRMICDYCDREIEQAYDHAADDDGFVMHTHCRFEHDDVEREDVDPDALHDAIHDR